MDLTQAFFNTLISCTTRYQIISVIGPNPQPYITKEDGEYTEIGITKSAYLGIFTEVHAHWESICGHDYEELVRGASPEDLHRLYVMTCGFMLTTNENHTIIYLHELVVYALNKIDPGYVHTELRLVSTLLHSRMARVNKSSSLWLYMKKLSIILVCDPLRKGVSCLDLFRMVVDRSLKSCEIHYANYYACNYLRWVVHALKHLKYVCGQDVDAYIDYFRTSLVAACKRSLSDVSLWSLLAELWSTSLNAYAIEEYTFLIHLINKLSNNQFNLNNLYSTFAVIPETRERDDVLEWLLRVDCTVYTPYKVVVDTQNVDKIKDRSTSVMKRVVEELEKE